MARSFSTRQFLITSLANIMANHALNSTQTAQDMQLEIIKQGKVFGFTAYRALFTFCREMNTLNPNDIFADEFKQTYDAVKVVSSVREELFSVCNSYDRRGFIHSLLYADEGRFADICEGFLLNADALERTNFLDSKLDATNNDIVNDIITYVLTEEQYFKLRVRVVERMWMDVLPNGDTQFGYLNINLPPMNIIDHFNLINNNAPSKKEFDKKVNDKFFDVLFDLLGMSKPQPEKEEPKENINIVVDVAAVYSKEKGYNVATHATAYIEQGETVFTVDVVKLLKDVVVINTEECSSVIAKIIHGNKGIRDKFQSEIDYISVDITLITEYFKDMKNL